MKALTLHTEFFCVHDLIQARYEVVRLVKQEKVRVAEAVDQFGFKSRSSYYLFARRLREQGLVGLFDMRPLERKLSGGPSTRKDHSSETGARAESSRPAASVWEPHGGAWHNAFYGLPDKQHGVFVQIVRAFAEGNGVRGISRIFGVDKNTVLHYLRRAACQCRRVTDLLVQGLRVEELQLDEMWSFVYKKQKHLTPREYERQLKGDQWCWVAIDARTKVLVQYEIGKRTYRLARDLLRHFRQRTDGTIPALVTSDEYGGYRIVLLDVYGVRTEGKRKVAPPEMDYVVISKTREKGRVVAIDVKVIFGNAERLREKLANSPVSNNANVAFVERSHLSRRQFNRRLARKTLGFSKKLENHRWHFELETAIHNFVRPHRALNSRTPMMAADKTGHPWTVEELLAFIPP